MFSVAATWAFSLSVTFHVLIPQRPPLQYTIAYAVTIAACPAPVFSVVTDTRGVGDGGILWTLPFRKGVSIAESLSGMSL